MHWLPIASVCLDVAVAMFSLSEAESLQCRCAAALQAIRHMYTIDVCAPAMSRSQLSSAGLSTVAVETWCSMPSMCQMMLHYAPTPHMT